MPELRGLRAREADSKSTGDHAFGPSELVAMAEAGDVPSQVEMGARCGWAAEDRADPERSAYWYGEAARRGSPEAMYCLSVCYLCGYGVSPDLAESRRWARACERALNKSGPSSFVRVQSRASRRA
jgi:hypothetical protein